MSALYQIEIEDAKGQKQSLSQYQGKALLIVNTASKCGFTPQYEGLEQLQQSYADKGFSVLAFPCNQFGKQEPGNNEAIQQFCQLTYQTQFPVFAKVDVNGDNAHPLYQWLKTEKKGLLGTRAIKWNFTKFLINPQGEVIKRYAPQDKPEAIAADIEALL